jgi:pyruvate formate lyase activating enzyme
MKEAILYKKLERGKVRCSVCNHRCVIAPRQRGICGVRENQNGRLYLLSYGKAIACNIDPIEKKPLFHFLPGTQSFSVAAVGCNFRCANCQNADISQASKEGYFFEAKKIPGTALAPSEIVTKAISSQCPSISYTYTEPTMFLEYALDTMKIAKEKGLKNIFVSNGYMTPETTKLLNGKLDAANIDLKSFSDESYLKNCGARLEPVLATLKLMKKLEIWLEITTLIIPQFNDSECEFQQIADFIVKELGPEVPWHVSQFYPTYNLMGTPQTPVEKIHKACEIGERAGLKYVYAGNIPGDKYENTYCPNCGEIMIDRLGYDVKRFDKNGRCSKCQIALNIIE